MNPASETLTSQSRALKDCSLTALALVEQAIERAQANTHLNAFVSLNPDHVRAQARASDRRRADGEALSPIDGLPIAIKDNFLTVDYPTTACSHAQPLEAPRIDATVVANLRAAGAVIFGKTNMHEWAFGATNTTSSIGATRNPHNPDHITGGSSGGSGAAVASGIVAAALGSDTGGSVRIPSAACGVYGFKPSYGRASRHGVLPLSWSLDAPGPIAGSLDDLALLLPFFLGVDRKDASTANARAYQAARSHDSPNMVNLVGAGLERASEVDAAVRGVLSRSGISVLDAEIPDIQSYFAAWETILHIEASSFHETRLEENPGDFSPVTRAHLEAGRALSAQEALRALKLRARFTKLLLNDYGDWDALVLPTLPVRAPRQDEDWQEFGGRRITTQDSMTWFCWLGNLAGLPCVSIPVQTSTESLPIGMMLMGRPGQDECLLDLARKFDAI